MSIKPSNIAILNNTSVNYCCIIAILNNRSVDYCCIIIIIIISRIRKSEATNLMQNIDLTEKSGT